MKKKGRNLLILLVVLILLSAAYFLLVQYNKSQEQSEANEAEVDTSVVVSTTEADSITGITVSGENGMYSLSKEGDAWIYDDDKSLPVNQSRVTEMLNMLKEVKAVRTVDEANGDLETYGLKVPRITVMMTTDDGQKTTYNIGSSNMTTGDYYFNTDASDKIFTVSFDFYYAFSHDLAGMMQTDSIPKIDTNGVNGFTIEKDGQTCEFVYMPGSVTSDYSGSYRWFMRSPFEKLTAIDTDKATALLADVTGLSYSKCVDYSPDVSALESYGLSSPRVTLTVDYVETTQQKVEGSEETIPNYEPKVFKLLIGNEADNETYVMAEGSKMVSSMSTSLLSDILAVNAEDYLPMDVCLIQKDNITAVRIEVPDGTFDVSVNKTESTDSDGNKTETTEYTVNGKSADASNFDAFYNSVTKIKGEKKAAEISEGQEPYITIGFSLNKDGFEEMTLKFIPYDSNFYRAEFNGRTDILVNRRDVESLLDKITLLGQ